MPSKSAVKILVLAVVAIAIVNYGGKRGVPGLRQVRSVTLG